VGINPIITAAIGTPRPPAAGKTVPGTPDFRTLPALASLSHATARPGTQIVHLWAGDRTTDFNSGTTPNERLFA
jgi:hypothetical protein